jgi:putative photosynthetic complex assembly protein
MAHAHIDDRPFPRGVLIGAGLLVAVSISAVGASRLGLLPGPQAQAAAATQAARPLAAREVRFSDREDGAVVIEDVAGGPPTVIPAGEGGFVRGVMRGLARDRRARDVGQEPAFRLTEWSDGRMTLEDTATGKRLDLNGFGPTNQQAMRDLLHAKGSGA